MDNTAVSGDQTKLAQLDQQLKEISTQASQPDVSGQPSATQPIAPQPVQPEKEWSKGAIGQQSGEGIVTDMASPPPPDTANIPTTPAPTPPAQGDSPPAVPEPSQVAGTPKTTVSSKFSGKFMWVLAVILFLVVAGLAAYLGVATAPKPTPQPTVEPVVEQTPLPLISKAMYLDGDFYRSEVYGFSFNHFGLDSSCCSISGPTGVETTVQLTLADASTAQEGTDAAFDGFAVYVVPNTDGETLTSFIAAQKSALLANYDLNGDHTLVKQTSSQTTIADKEATLLTGYAWWGADLYFAQLSTGDFLVLSKQDATAGSFDDQFEDVLSTFVFVDVLVKGKSVECSSPRPEFCTEECIANPPYICGDTGKSYCSVCSACSDSAVTSYTYQDTQCTSSAGQICGGIAGIECPSGYSCDLGGSQTPDASGVCVLAN